jgi:riboflavin kinase/FMN adenylyltransferase
MVLQEDSNIKPTQYDSGKQELLEEIGIENLVIHPFDEAFFTTNRRGVCKNSFGRKISYKKLSLVMTIDLEETGLLILTI